MKRIINIFIFVSALYVEGHAQVMSLDSVLLQVDRQNPMLQEYDSKVKALNTYSEGAKSWMAPMVGVGTFMTPYPGQMIMDERDKGSVMVSVEQSIPNPARLNANKKYLSSKAAVETEARAYQFNVLRAEAKTLYYQWAVAEHKMQLLKESDRIVSLMVKLAQVRYPYNQASLGSIYKAEARREEVQNMVLMTEGTVNEKKYRLKALMNMPATEPLQVDTSATSGHVVIADTTSWDQRSDIRQIDKTIAVMELNRQLQQSQAKPEFKIRFDHMQPLADAMPRQFTAMAMVSIPIAPWSSKMYKAEVKGMQYDIEAMQRKRSAVLLESKGMISGMGTQLNYMQRQLQNYKTKILPALRKNYETVMLAYEENREQLPMVIDAWEALNMSQLEYLDKMESFYIMLVNYEKQLEI